MKKLSERLPVKQKISCHKLVWATAVEMAGELYDDMMKDNENWKRWKELCPELTPIKLEIEFIELAAPKLIPTARHTLARLLEGSLSEDLKRTIYDALLKDAALRPTEHRAHVTIQ